MAEWWRQISSGITDFAEQLVQQANTAQQDIEREHKRLAAERAALETQQHIASNVLPWEPLFIPTPIGSARDKDREALSILEQDLMEKILSLSLSPGNFNTTPINSEEIKSQNLFRFSEFVPIAMRLLELDTNLARMHSKLSPKMDEQVFWFNYYCRVLFLRASVGMDGAAARERAASWLQAQPEIIHHLSPTSASAVVTGPSSPRPSPPVSNSSSSSSSAPSKSVTTASNSVAVASSGKASSTAGSSKSVAMAAAVSSPDEKESGEDVKKMLEELDFDLDDLNLDDEDTGSGESFEKIDMLGNKLSSSRGSKDGEGEGEEELDEDAALERQIALELAEDD